MRKQLRQAGILEMVGRAGYLSVADAATALSVTPQTIRRDFEELISTGAIIRHHGGATPNPTGKVASYATRRSYLGNVKRGIARCVVQLIPPGSSIFIETGTTLEALASFLPQVKLARVVTNNAHLALALARHDAWPVHVPHGEIRPADGAIVGERAAASLGEYRFDLAVIGAGAVAKGAILDYEVADVSIARAAIALSRNTLLAVDATKFRHEAPLHVAPVSAVTSVVTDQPPPAELEEVLAKAEVALHLVNAG